MQTRRSFPSHVFFALCGGDALTPRAIIRDDFEHLFTTARPPWPSPVRCPRLSHLPHSRLSTERRRADQPCCFLALIPPLPLSAPSIDLSAEQAFDRLMVR